MRYSFLNSCYITGINATSNVIINQHNTLDKNPKILILIMRYVTTAKFIDHEDAENTSKGINFEWNYFE